MKRQDARAPEGGRRGSGTPARSWRSRWARAIPPAALFSLVVALYLPSIGNGFLYDDRALILRRPPLRSAADVATLWTSGYYPELPYYRPLASASFAVQKTLHGENPVLFHLFNVLAAGAVAILVHALLSQPGLRIAPWTALLAAAAFAAHPVFSSCVDPISGRDTLLAIGFVVGSVTAFLRGTRTGTAVGLGLFALGLLTKEAAVVTPALVLLADALGVSNARVRRARDWLVRAAPLAGVLAAYALVRLALFAGSEFRTGEPSLFPMSYLYLVQTTLVPFVALLYEPSVAAWMSIPRLAVAALVLGGVGIAATRASRAVRPLLVLWPGWAFLSLLPAANLIWQETEFDERYVALAALALVAGPAVVISDRCAGARARRVAVLAGWGLVSLLAAMSWGRASQFEELAFYRRWIEVRPQSVKPHFNLANALSRRGRLDEAIAEYLRALAIDGSSAKVHYNLGLAYVSASKLEPAIHHFQEAIRLDPDNGDARNNLGTVLAMRGDLPGAEEQFRQVLRRQPANPLALRNLGYALVQQGKYPEAIALLRETVRLEPQESTPHKFLGIALLRSGQADPAERELREALRLAPGDGEAAGLLDEIRPGILLPRASQKGSLSESK